MKLQDTICAISTPIGEAGIGIVRISGNKAISIARKIFKPSGKVNWKKSFRLHHGWVVDPKTQKKVDEVLLSIMRAPKTYTREDMVEINCHGGPLPLRKTLELVLGEGARLAEPGEFTKRAFLNGRIDLTQAESVLEIVRAKTEESLYFATERLCGALFKKMNHLKEHLLELVSLLEAEIDFRDEEEISLLSREEKKKKIEFVLREVKKLIRTSEAGRFYREGVKAVIVGRPNVGKSSLLNTLLQEERAIVTPIPGTTRDIIEEVINIEGFPLRMIDTAGLREVKDLVEVEGVKKTKTHIDEADLLLVMVDGSESLTREDRVIFEKIERKEKILILNKIDLPQVLKEEEVRKIFPGVPLVKISCTREWGMEELKKEIKRFILHRVKLPSTSVLVATLREKESLLGAKKELEEALKGIEENLPPEFIAVELKEALSRIGEITGEVSTEDILEQIFSRFCIGK